jgi:hypothetical protein
VGMTSLVSTVRSQVLGRLARRIAGTGGPYAGLALLPDKVLWPLHRDGLDPVEQMAQRRGQEPVSRLSVPFGLRVWLVTGDEPVWTASATTSASSPARSASTSGRTPAAWVSPTRRCTPGCARC